jgi:hypothetical protein
VELTGFLLHRGQLVPIDLHAVPQGDPQLGLLLGRHGLPPLLNVGQGGVGECLRLHSGLQAGDWRVEGGGDGGSGGAGEGAAEGGSEHDERAMSGEKLGAGAEAGD